MDNEYDEDMENTDDLKDNEYEGLDDDNMDDLFYKDTIKPDEPTIIVSPAVQGMLPYFIKITGFSFGVDVKPNSRTCIVVKDTEEDDEPGVVGILTAGKQENIQVDVLVSAQQIFELKGDNVSQVYVTGQLVPRDTYMPNDMLDNEEGDLDEDELEELMRMKGAQRRKRGEDLDLDENETSPQIDDVDDEEEEIQEPPAKKQKTNNGKPQTTQKKPNQQNNNNNNKNKNNNNNNNNNTENKDNESEDNKNQNKKNKKNKKKNKNKNKKSPQQNPQQEPQEQKKEEEKPKSPKQQNPKSPQQQQQNKNNPKSKDLVNLGQGLKMKKLKEGQGKQAKKGSTVKVYYVGQLADKTIFDKCLSGDGFKFKVGEGSVIKGWDKGVEGMKIGEKRRLVIPPHLAYGKEGSAPEIPPNSQLTFTIEVKSIN